MNREIKFRAWVAKEKVMVDWQELIDDQYEFNEFNVEGGLLFLQYTGLKDKNGKEVYEGDLFYFSKFSTYPAEVYYDERSCQFRGRIKGEMQFDKTYLLYSIEVIGNIYEDRELLKDKL